MSEEQQAPAVAFSLLSDQPALDGVDPLGFEEIAGELAQLVRRSRASTPFALGVEGAWGSGKSTLMERLRCRLEDDTSVRTVAFNAWAAAEDDVAEGLVKTVLERLDRSVVRRALRNRQLVGWVRIAVNVAAGWLHLGSVVDLFWRETAIDPQTRNRMRELIEQAVAEWSEKHETRPGEGRLLCVVVDDLDRCSPRAAMEVLEAIKLYLNVPGIVFVIGFDQTIVSELVLRERGYSEAIKAHAYLEKFIQIKYRVPRPAMERSRALVRALLLASGTQDLFGDEQLDLLVDRNASNPRRIKRFINDFVLAYGMDPAWREFEPATLIQVQLLIAYFEDFGRLLSTQEEPDPLEEFAEYRDARESLRRIESTGPAATTPRAFDSHRLPLPDTVRPEDVARLLRALENELPLAFPRLVDDRELCALVESLRGAEDWRRLRRRLLGRELVVDAGSENARGGEAGEVRLDGLSVLWVDDTHEANASLAHDLQRLGATVELVGSTESAQASLTRQRFDALISDIDRDGDPDAGFAALELFRGQGIAPPVVVFYAARVTGARLTRAKELGASVTSRPAELIAHLAGASPAGSRRPAPFFFAVVGAPGDEGLVNRLRSDLEATVPGGHSTTDVAADGVPLGDVLIVAMGEGWERAMPDERHALLASLRTFAETGAPVLFGYTSASPQAVEADAAAITRPRPAQLVSLKGDGWELGVLQLGLFAELAVASVRQARGLPA